MVIKSVVSWIFSIVPVHGSYFHITSRLFLIFYLYFIYLLLDFALFLVSWEVSSGVFRIFGCSCMFWNVPVLQCSVFRCSWKNYIPFILLVFCFFFGSISVSGQLRTYPSPNPTCYNKLIS